MGRRLRPGRGLGGMVNCCYSTGLDGEKTVLNNKMNSNSLQSPFACLRLRPTTASLD